MSAAHDAPLPPLVKTCRVAIGPAAAFERFTRDLGLWWPLETHSVGEDRAISCAMEEGVGGRIVERTRDGSEHVWGTITDWQPPAHLSFTWHPGRAADTAQTIDVRFAVMDDGGTLVTLEQGGWSALGERAAAMRSGYDSGWDFVLGERFGGAARR